MIISLLKDFSERGFYFRIAGGKVIEAWDNKVTFLKEGVDFFVDPSQGQDDIIIRYQAPNLLPKEENPTLGEN